MAQTNLNARQEALRQADRGTLLLATSFGFLLFLIVVACVLGQPPLLRIRSPPSAVLSNQPDHAMRYMERVVGLPGDGLQLIKGRPPLNREPVATEPVAGAATATAASPLRTSTERFPGDSYRSKRADGANGRCPNMPAFAVPAGNLLVHSDNRANLIDSRHQTPNFRRGLRAHQTCGRMCHRHTGRLWRLRGRDPMSAMTSLVLFSAGQDSTVCLAWALEHFARVETIGFAYGQRHSVEMGQRPLVRAKLAESFPAWSSRLGEDHVLELATLSTISDTALTRQAEFQMTAAGLPNTFVPGRNLLFFTYAAALAYGRGIRTLIGGMCETDFSGYPDCRNDTLQTLAKAISLGMDAHFTIETPLMRIDKAGTWAMAQRLGGTPLVDLIVEHTHSCYTPERTARWAWGYGCGRCPACGLRQRGWEKWQTGKT